MKKQDNRNFFYGTDNQTSNRPEYLYIQRWVTEGAKVIDLGCGNGSLLALLKETKNITELGLDISESGIKTCLKKAITARVGRIDVEMKEIDDDSFDFAICNVTLHMVMYPEVALREMKRISRYQIISFPNFAYLLNRLELFFIGRMPRRLLSGYQWYNTGHIHHFSVKDFKETIKNLIGLNIKSCYYYGGLRGLNLICPNLLAAGSIFLMEKQI